MTETTNDSGLVTRARELYEADTTGIDTWDSLSDEDQAGWIDLARETPPTARRLVRKVLGKEPLPPFGVEAAEATGIDPRGLHRREHRDFELEWGNGVKAVRLLAKPSPEDQEIRKDLLERGLPVFSTDEGVTASVFATDGDDTSVVIRVVSE